MHSSGYQTVHPGITKAEPAAYESPVNLPAKPLPVAVYRQAAIWVKDPISERASVWLFGFPVFLLLRCPAVRLSHYSAVLQFLCFTVPLLRYSAVRLSKYLAVLCPIVRLFHFPLFYCSAVPLFRFSAVPLFRCSAVPLFCSLVLYTLASSYLSFKVSIIFSDLSAICKYFSRLFWNDPALPRRPLACWAALTSAAMIPKFIFIGSKCPMDDEDT